MTPTVSRVQVNGSSSHNTSAVERAGYCADGDHCERWHCRACGRYWLGDAKHHCDSAVHELEQTIRTWMEEALEEDGDVATCARLVLQRVKAAGLGEALLDAYGDRLIAALWEDRDHDDDDHRRGRGKASARAGQVNGASVVVQQPRREVHQVAVTPPTAALARRERQPGTPGSRRVDVAQLATGTALLDSLFQVAGQWVRLGDLDKSQCRALSLEYRALHLERAAAADDARARSLAFRQLAADLGEGQTIRQRWTAKQLKALVGDTLRGAAPARPKATSPKPQALACAGSRGYWA